MAAFIAAAFVLSAEAPATAALSRAALKDVGFHLVPGAPVPATAALRGIDGRDTTLGRALDGKPALLVFTDYRCESLCGIVLDELAETLPKARLRLGTDYNVIAVALDATETAADATRFRDQHTAGSTLRARGLFFTEDAPALAAMRDSVGLVAPFDAEHKQFAHPAGLVLIDAAGKARRILSPFALDPLDLRLALTDGGAEPSSFVAHALLLCYGWNPVAGIYTLRIERVMAIAAALTVALIGLGVGLLLYHERRVPRTS
jgi:protein SCO1/2